MDAVSDGGGSYAKFELVLPCPGKLAQEHSIAHRRHLLHPHHEDQQNQQRIPSQQQQQDHRRTHTPPHGQADLQLVNPTNHHWPVCPQ